MAPNNRKSHPAIEYVHHATSRAAELPRIAGHVTSALTAVKKYRLNMKVGSNKGFSPATKPEIGSDAGALYISWLYRIAAEIASRIRPAPSRTIDMGRATRAM